MKILKLGGSILKNTFSFVPKLLDEKKLVIVVSAPFGLTDELLKNDINDVFLGNMYEKISGFLGGGFR